MRAARVTRRRSGSPTFPVMASRRPRKPVKPTRRRGRRADAGRIAMVVNRAPAPDERLALFGHAARSTRLLVRLGQAFEIPAIDFDWLFSATCQQKPHA